MRVVVCGLVLFSLSYWHSEVSAQCECDHTVGLDMQVANGDEMGVSPGDRVCITGGEREFLRIRRMIGTPEAPITLINCEGVVDIRNEDRAYALVIEEESQYFHLTGTGDEGAEYGFRASAPATEPYPGVGLWILGRASDYEVDHVEVYETGFAGVSAKTDPTCDGLADQDVFIQHSAELHHIWAHDTGGEGFYVGSTQSDGHRITCEGAQEVHQPHWLDGISIHDNLVEDTGWDGMQVGMARTGCEVYRNIIRRVGGEGVEFQQQGLQIGTFSSCDVHHNVISDGPVMGIIVLGAATSTFHHNLIVRFAEDGIYANHRDRDDSAEYRFFFNTIVDYGAEGIQVFGGSLGAVEAANNLVVGEGAGISAGGDVPFTEDHNIEVDSRAEAGFMGDDDYHLAEGSVARGAGRAIEGYALDLDQRGHADPPSVGAYEYSEDAVDVDAGPPLDLDAGTPPARGDDAAPTPGRDGGSSSVDAAEDGEGAADEGCGCRTKGSPSGALWVLLALGLLRRRR